MNDFGGSHGRSGAVGNGAIAPGQVTVTQAATARGVTRLRHFTTNSGVTGILATGEVRSRDLLARDDYLDRVYLPNCDVRYDPAWTGYVSISVTDINASFFNICSGSRTWHRDMDGFWAVIEIDPAVLDHEDVWFATTNNRYSNAKQERGALGFEAMFADQVYPYWPLSAHRPFERHGLASNQTTDPQAELLYPDAVPTEYVTAILVASEEDAHSVLAQLGYFAQRRPGLDHIEVRVDPSAFRQRVPGSPSGGR